MIKTLRDRIDNQNLQAEFSHKLIRVEKVCCNYDNHTIALALYYQDAFSNVDIEKNLDYLIKYFSSMKMVIPEQSSDSNVFFYCFKENDNE